MVEHNEQNTLQMVEHNEQNTLQMVEHNEQNTLQMVEHPPDGWLEHPRDGWTPFRWLNTLQMVERNTLHKVELPVPWFNWTSVVFRRQMMNQFSLKSCDIPIKIIYSLRTVPSQMRLETGL